jgi:hypothetical protein
MKSPTVAQGQEAIQFRVEPGQVHRRWAAAFQIGNLAVDATPVAGIVGIQIDADRDTAGAA